jgi:hypothetical protein
MTTISLGGVGMRARMPSPTIVAVGDRRSSQIAQVLAGKRTILQGVIAHAPLSDIIHS